MKTLTKENKNYLWGFESNSIKPEGIEAKYDFEGWYGGRHLVDVNIETSKGIVFIRFAHCDMWGYVNNLGRCKLNGAEAKTSDLIGEYKYSMSESNLINIVEKIWNI